MDARRNELAVEGRVGRRILWGKGTMALALGYGSLYNHCYEPNARYEDVSIQTKLFVAIRDIAEGEEITVNYNGEPDDRSPVWFDVIEGSVPKTSIGMVDGAD